MVEAYRVRLLLSAPRWASRMPGGVQVDVPAPLHQRMGRKIQHPVVHMTEVPSGQLTSSGFCREPASTGFIWESRHAPFSAPRSHASPRFVSTMPSPQYPASGAPTSTVASVPNTPPGPLVPLASPVPATPAPPEPIVPVNPPVAPTLLLAWPSPTAPESPVPVLSPALPHATPTMPAAKRTATHVAIPRTLSMLCLTSCSFMAQDDGTASSTRRMHEEICDGDIIAEPPGTSMPVTGSGLA